MSEQNVKQVGEDVNSILQGLRPDQRDVLEALCLIYNQTPKELMLEQPLDCVDDVFLT